MEMVQSVSFEIGGEPISQESNKMTVNNNNLGFHAKSKVKRLLYFIWLHGSFGCFCPKLCICASVFSPALPASLPWVTMQVWSNSSSIRAGVSPLWAEFRLPYSLWRKPTNTPGQFIIISGGHHFFLFVNLIEKIRMSLCYRL